MSEIEEKVKTLEEQINKQQEILNSLREENVKKKERIRELTEELNKKNEITKQSEEINLKLQEYEKIISELNNTKAELEKRLKQEEEQKLKEKTEREKLFNEFEQTKKLKEELENFRKSIVEKEEAEKNDILENQIKPLGEAQYKIAVAIQDIELLKTYRDEILQQKENKTHLVPGNVKLSNAKIKLEDLSGTDLLKLEKENPELFKEIIRSGGK